MNGPVGMAAAAVGVGAASGADSFRAGLGLVLVDRARARRWVIRLIVADAAGLVLGAAAGSALPLALADTAPLIGLTALSALAIVAILGTDDVIEGLLASRSLSLAVPVLLSIDNVTAGAALGSLGYPVLVVVPVAVVTSSVVGGAGIAIGSLVRWPSLEGASVRLGGVFLGIAVAIAIMNG